MVDQEAEPEHGENDGSQFWQPNEVSNKADPVDSWQQIGAGNQRNELPQERSGHVCCTILKPGSKAAGEHRDGCRRKRNGNDPQNRDTQRQHFPADRKQMEELRAEKPEYRGAVQRNNGLAE
ncbi:hypothetical protein [uncultured Dysosmobacter sp.]|uniref:hypothetical protein n=1 Tax=uncultured Dysosmobacter sp. TaxID=2591384 RepID=UPI0026271959|nr:hypothetical protein [uncultured Dysosmobacter sp.]